MPTRDRTVPENPPPALRAGGAATPWLAALVAVAFQLPLFDRWFSAMDEGHMLYFADLVNQGRLLYRDATIYPLPGSFYLLAALFRIFEPSILVSRCIAVVEFAAFVGLSAALLRRLVPPGWTWAGVALLLLYRIWSFPHWQMYSYSTTALLLLLGSLLALVRFTESGRRGTLALSGVLFGLGVFCKQDYGAVALLASLGVLAVFARSGPAEGRASLPACLGWFLLPAAAVGALAGLHFLAQGMLMQVVQFTVLNHFVGLSTYEYPAFPSLFPLFQQDPAVRTPAGMFNGLPGIVQTVHVSDVVQSRWFTDTAVYDTLVKLFIFGPRLLVAAGAVRLWRLRQELERPEARPRFLAELALLSTAAAFVLLSALYRPQDYLHFAVLYWPLICLAVVYARALWRWRARLAVGLAAAGAVPAALFLGYSGWLVWSLREQNTERIDDPRGGVYVKPAEAALLRDVTDYLRSETEPGETVAIVPYFVIAHFLAEREGPHGASYILWPFAEYANRDQRVIDAMEEQGTRLVLYNFTEFPAFPPASEYAPDLFAYLVDRFEIDRVFSYDTFGYKLAGLRRSAEDRAGRPLLDDDAPAELGVRARSGRLRPVPPAARDRFLARTSWPFRPVVALRPTAGGGQTELAVPLDVPPNARLHTAVGTHPRSWFAHPPTPVRFSILAERGGRRELLWSRILDPHEVQADRGWFDVDVPLGAFAGESLRIVLATATQGPAGETLGMGGFAQPRIVAEPGD